MQFAHLEWKNGQPFSPDFGDIYFSTENGQQETEHVFVHGNRLEQRFPLAKQGFTIIETGFGTGLNFLTVAAHWLALAPQGAQLRYFSIEKYPLLLNDLRHAHALWPQFVGISDELLAQYAQLKAGNNQMSMAGSRILLGLQADDILCALPQLSRAADAWILDGFAPAKNADMWTSDVFAHMVRLSGQGTTFATFTSAGHVRRGLQAAGFEVNKLPGFGKKREMISGCFKGQA